MGRSNESAITTIWPSGLRRWLKAPFRKGVGSNPTVVIFPCPPVEREMLCSMQHTRCLLWARGVYGVVRRGRPDTLLSRVTKAHAMVHDTTFAQYRIIIDLGSAYAHIQIHALANRHAHTYLHTRTACIPVCLFACVPVRLCACIACAWAIWPDVCRGFFLVGGQAHSSERQRLCKAGGAPH